MIVENLNAFGLKLAVTNKWTICNQMKWIAVENKNNNNKKDNVFTALVLYMFYTVNSTSFKSIS